MKAATQPTARRPPRSPRIARLGRATRADLLSDFAGLLIRSAESGTARPASVKTRYSGLTGHDDGQPDDDAGLAAGEQEVRGDARAETRFHLRTGVTSVAPCLHISGSRSFANAGKSLSDRPYFVKREVFGPV